MREIFITVKLVMKNLRANPGITFLTLFGVVIGITAVIVISSSGQGVKGYVINQVNSFGTDLIQVETKVPATKHISHQNALGQAMGIQITTLKLKDAEEIKKLPNVKNVYGANIGQEITSYQDSNKKVMLFGAGADVIKVDVNLKLSTGRFYDESEDNSLEQVAVIGSEIADVLFGEDNPLGKNIKIKDKNFRVIGVLEKRGTVSFFNFDELVYIPVKTLQKKILGVDYIKMISVQVKDMNQVEATQLEINDLMRKQHDIKDPNKDDFSVISIQEAQDMINDVFKTVNLLLMFLTSISLIVGGVGIMNVMYVAVVERTYEIGLRKAVVAKAKDILRQFLLEAIFITLAGGIIGILLGFSMSFLLSYIFTVLGYELQFMITGQALLLAGGFSITVGLIFGYYPARVAARLSQIGRAHV